MLRLFYHCLFFCTLLATYQVCFYFHSCYWQMLIQQHCSGNLSSTFELFNVYRFLLSLFLQPCVCVWHACMCSLCVCYMYVYAITYECIHYQAYSQAWLDPQMPTFTPGPSTYTCKQNCVNKTHIFIWPNWLGISVLAEHFH